MADKGKIYPTVPGTMYISPTGNVFGNKRPGEPPKDPPKRAGLLKRLWQRLRGVRES